jgi:hypothetical protein
MRLFFFFAGYLSCFDGMQTDIRPTSLVSSLAIHLPSLRPTTSVHAS